MRLLFFMTTAMLLYMAHFIYFNRQMEFIPLSDTLYCFCNPAVFPLYYLYIEELTEYQHNRWRQALYLLPSAVCFLLVGVIYLLMNAEETDVFIQRHLYGNEYTTLTGLVWWQGVAHAIVKVVFALQIPWVLFFELRRITNYNAMVESNYSDVEEKKIVGMKTMLVLFTVASFFSFVFNLIGRQPFVSGPFFLLFPALLFSVLLLLIGHIGLSQRFNVKDVDADIFMKPVTECGENTNSELLERIRKLVNDEQLFLYPNLKVSDLSSRLNTNRNYIYHAVNVEMGISFNDYINGLRVDYASKLLETEPELTINEVMMRSGFSSSSSFYRNFKKFKGITPTEKRTVD